MPDWIITGGETDQGGHKARPTHPEWFRRLRDQAAAAGAAFHHKQNGEWKGCPDNTGGEWPIEAERYCRLYPDADWGPMAGPCRRSARSCPAGKSTASNTTLFRRSANDTYSISPHLARHDATHQDPAAVSVPDVVGRRPEERPRFDRSFQSRQWEKDRKLGDLFQRHAR